MAGSVCRICLGGNIRMVIIHDEDLLKAFEKLTGTKLHTEKVTGLPNTVCFVCHRQLQRLATFCHVACESDRIMQDLLLKKSNGTGYTTVTAQVPEMHNLCMTKAKTLVSINIPLSDTACAEQVNME